MSDSQYDAYAERQREDALEELWRVLPNYYDGDSHQAVIDNFCKVVEKSYPEYHNYIDNDDIAELVMEYTDSLR